MAGSYVVKMEHTQTYLLPRLFTMTTYGVIASTALLLVFYIQLCSKTILYPSSGFTPICGWHYQGQTQHFGGRRQFASNQITLTSLSTPVTRYVTYEVVCDPCWAAEWREVFWWQGEYQRWCQSNGSAVLSCARFCWYHHLRIECTPPTKKRRRRRKCQRFCDWWGQFVRHYI